MTSPWSAAELWDGAEIQVVVRAPQTPRAGEVKAVVDERGGLGGREIHACPLPGQVRGGVAAVGGGDHGAAEAAVGWGLVVCCLNRDPGDLVSVEIVVGLVHGWWWCLEPDGQTV